MVDKSSPADSPQPFAAALGAGRAEQPRCSPRLCRGRGLRHPQGHRAAGRLRRTPAARLAAPLRGSLQRCRDLGNCRSLRRDVSCLARAESALTHSTARLACFLGLISCSERCHLTCALHWHAQNCTSEAASLFSLTKIPPSGTSASVSPRNTVPDTGTCSPLMCQTKVHGFVLLQMKS